MLEGPQSATSLVLFTVKLVKIIRHTFRNTAYSKAIYKISLHHAISMISITSKMAEADGGPLSSNKSNIPGSR